uniref:Uncharacterized protein LOC100176163 n=1 Tax=Phallusia mammillata TaxID=59560 RepID=A0A6F9DHA3_9ASCI|nr:uncharacterized protein LOC100176163 [Phallusia mammillata]
MNLTLKTIHEFIKFELFTMSSLLLHSDSLENMDEEIEGTYRVNLPQPHAVENEEEFMTNSARNIKSASYDSLDESPTYQQQRLKYATEPKKRSQKKQFEMTESLQAQLHLSLDRLSQASYNQEEKQKQINNNEKISSSPIKHFVLPPSHSTQSPIPGHIKQDAQQPESGSSGETRTVSQGKFLSLKDSLSNTSMAAIKRSNLEDSDNDDIHTVGVGDSLDGELEQNLLSEDNFNMEQSLVDSGTAKQSDPYADLRYNPEWREVDGQKSEVQTEEQKTSSQVDKHAFVIDFSERPRLPSTPPQVRQESEGDLSNLIQPSGGAITVHNTELSPTRPDSVKNQTQLHKTEHSEGGYHISRDSPVRLSADPGKLDSMNKLYEDEFARMLEMERQWARENPSQIHQGDQGVQEIGNHYHMESDHSQNLQDLKTNEFRDGKPKETYYSPRLTSNDSRTQTSSTVNNSAKSLRNRRTLHMTSHVPTPPKAPKSNRERDYIEMNKARLGRKSNSASYLEMYSKRNKQLQDEQDSRNSEKNRPSSDKPKQKSETYISRYEASRSSDPQKENGSVIGLEDAWKQQAERLKEIKDARSTQAGSKLQQRKTLKEVGNTSQFIRPRFDPEEVLKKSVSPRNVPSPRKYGNFPKSEEESSFADHPAFTTFKQQQDASFYRQQMLHEQYTRLNQHQDSSAGVSSSYQESDDSQQSDNYAQGYQHIPSHSSREVMQGDSRYFYINNESDQNHRSPARPSPLMQAYQHRYDRQQASSEHQLHHHHQQQHYRAMELPPKPSNPLSPRDIRGDFFAEESQAQRPKFRTSPDSNLYHEQPRVYSLKKRVNFDPAVCTPDSPASRIPVPTSSQAIYKYPVPLPPTNNSINRTVGSYASSPRSGMQYAYEGDREVTWSATIPGSGNHQQSVPLLPPIIGATNSRAVNEQREDLDSSRASDDAGGSYLEQYERQKQKAKYKRYTLEDYKNLKRDLNLGGLGPDLLSAKEKMGKIDRARKYAEFIRQQHKSNQQVVQRKTLDGDETTLDDETLLKRDDDKHRFVVGADSEEKRREQKEKRKRAMEYARQVPKPKTIFNTSQGAEKTPRKPNTLDNNGEPLDWDLLKTLQERHEREKALVADFSSTKLT